MKFCSLLVIAEVSVWWQWYTSRFELGYVYVLCEFGFSVGNAASQRRRQHAVTVGKERREALMRTKRLCRVGVSGDSDDPSIDDSDMMIEEDQSILEAQTTSAVEELKLDVAYQYGDILYFAMKIFWLWTLTFCFILFSILTFSYLGSL